VRPMLIIGKPPHSDEVLGLDHRGELMYVEAFIAQSAVTLRDSIQVFSTGVPSRMKSRCTRADKPNLRAIVIGILSPGPT
jgi:hypothetical protein